MAESTKNENTFAVASRYPLTSESTPKSSTNGNAKDDTYNEPETAVKNEMANSTKLGALSRLEDVFVSKVCAITVSGNIDILLTFICDLVNLSISTGNIDGVKLAHITPLVKGDSLDPDNLTNYRPISNLSFIGKLIERIVLKRLNDHMDINNLHMPQQAAYKKHNSTETLLIRIVNDLIIASDEKSCTVVMLLDLSAAFDTVDHTKLITILEKEIGVSGTALNWFRSFLSGRAQKVKIGPHESEEVIILFGVPQGSVLGPVLFNIYIRSLYVSVQRLNFNIFGFADDHQVFKQLKKPQEASVLITQLPNCFTSILNWMQHH